MKKYCILALFLGLSAIAAAHSAEDEAFLDTSYHTLQDAVLPKARWKRSDIASLPKFGGYINGYYKYNGQPTAHGGEGFGLRLVRVYVDGTVFRDFKYRLQMELNGTPHIKDAFISWSHWTELEVKVGQFKRCFTFENPYNPWDVGTGDYSQLAKKFSGFGDRVGEASMGGRDLGLQLQGDLFPSRHDKHRLLHYAVAVYNGQGINQSDVSRRKDFIGTLQYSPIRDLQIGVFGWIGDWKSATGVTVDRNRLAAGVKYEGRDNHWSARAEYARSWGHKASDYVAATDTTMAFWKGGNKADAWYVTVGAPVWRWIKVYAKYDAYRDYANRHTLHTIYSLSANLQPHKNLMLQLQYNVHDDKASAPHVYHQFWAQTYVRF
ncbi:MAG: porin [Bacteroidaceae bacterium]|nr:porin [Bacteroidaceae bacterium]